MKTLLLLLGLAMACALWAPDAEASTIFRAPNNLSLSQGLVGWWNFDGKTVSGVQVADASGTGNRGIMTNGPTLVNGKLGQALSFDGSDDYVSLGNVLGFTSSFSISAWVFIEDAGDCSGYIINKNGGPGARDWSLFYECDTFLFRVSADGTNVTDRHTATAVAPNTWVHVVGAYSASEQRLDVYTNGIFDNGDIDGTIPASINASGNNVRIGSRQSTNDFFKTKLDDVRVYNRALSPDEIKRLYKIGASAKLGIAASNNSLSQGLVGWWNFDGKTVSGVQVADASGAGNRGIMTNGPKAVYGKIGQALSFDGSNDYVDVAAASSINNLAVKTVSAWINIGTSPGSGGIASKDTCGLGWYFFVDRDNRRLQYDHCFSGPATFPEWVSPTNSLKANTWHHVILIYDRTNSSNDPIFYIDGVIQTTADGAPSGGSAGDDSDGLLEIGAFTGGTDGHFNGLIDDVRVYNRALSPDEIKRLYKTGATAKLGIAASNNSLSQGLVGWWNFDGKTVSGVQVADASGAGNRGIMTNGPTITEGKIGQGMEFFGTDQFVSMGNVGVPLDGGTNDVSQSAWIKAARIQNSDIEHIIIGNGARGTNPGYGLELLGSSGVLRCRISDGTPVIFNGVTDLRDDSWHHVACVATMNGSGILYIDGQIHGTPTSIGNLGDKTSGVSFTIGERSTADRGFRGLIDDVRIYNRVLSPDEIKRLYNMGR
jgi:hypothetical protein